MSKRDIQTVCELAAHLAKRSKRVQTESGGETLQSVWDHKAETCASDAMTLQRLSRRTRNMFKKLDTVWAYRIELGVQEKARIVEAADAILKPYGLSCIVSGEYPGFYIKGLPANTESAIEEFLI